MLCIGCGGKPKTQQQEKPKPEKPILGGNVAIVTAPGHAEVRGQDQRRELLYQVRWKQAQIRIGDQGIFGGSMEGVSGAAYADGAEVHTFQADAGRADKETQVLTLTGHVILVSKRQNVRMNCDRVEWHAREKLIKATGHIVLSGTSIVTTGVQELWASADLSRVGTPDLFSRK